MTELTSEDRQSLVSFYGLRQDEISRIDGARRHDSAKAAATVYGRIGETMQSTCITWRWIVSGDIVTDTVHWAKEDSPQLDQIIWLSNERNGQPCSDMLDSPTILLESYIEENTIQRLHEQGLPLALDAGRQLREPISPSKIREGRTTRLGVASLGERVVSGTYRLTWTINQCLGLSIAVKSGNKGDFEVVHVWRIVC